MKDVQTTTGYKVGHCDNCITVLFKVHVPKVTKLTNTSNHSCKEQTFLSSVIRLSIGAVILAP